MILVRRVRAHLELDELHGLKAKAKPKQQAKLEEYPPPSGISHQSHWPKIPRSAAEGPGSMGCATSSQSLKCQIQHVTSVTRRFAEALCFGKV